MASDNQVVEVNGLQKAFSVKHKAAGLRGSVQALWKTETKEITAVSDISFSLQKGEMLALGPTFLRRITYLVSPSGNP